MGNKKKKGAIPAPLLPPTKNISFSFKHLDEEHPRFKVSECGVEFFCELIAAMKKYSEFTVDQFTDQNNHDNRHIIRFADTSEPDGFTSLDADNLRLEDPWQIGLCPDKKKPPHSGWRVHGFLLDGVFYAVWLDSAHRLYPNYGFPAQPVPDQLK